MPQNQACVFTSVSADELLSVLKLMCKKSCTLDPIPGPLVKDCLEDLLPVIARIINLSFQNAMVLAGFKEAVLDPIATKDLLDNEI